MTIFANYRIAGNHFKQTDSCYTILIPKHDFKWAFESSLGYMYTIEKGMRLTWAIWDYRNRLFINALKSEYQHVHRIPSHSKVRCTVAYYSTHLSKGPKWPQTKWNTRSSVFHALSRDVVTHIANRQRLLECQ